MKPVKTLPKFQCDFCSKRSTRHVMERHEIECFKNPKRICRRCGNRRTIQKVENEVQRASAALNIALGSDMDMPEKIIVTTPCPDCARIAQPRTP